MTVERNYVIAIATLSDWFDNLAALYQPMRRKTKTNSKSSGRPVFPALWASYTELLRIWIGSLRCLQMLWLVQVITFGIFLRHSIENRPKQQYSNALILWPFAMQAKPETSICWPFKPQTQAIGIRLEI